MKPLLCLLFAFLIPTFLLSEELTRKQVEFFEKSVRPILAKNCYQCHSKDARNLKAGLYLDSRDGVRNGGKSGPAIEPGNPQKSLLIQAVRQQGKLKMPPKKKLSSKDLHILKTWIQMGAPDPRVEDQPSLITRHIDIEKGRRFWAFQPVAKPDITKSKGNWAKSDLDRLIQTRHQEKGLKVINSAQPATLLRRLYFDLIGLPPSPEQIESFLSEHSKDSHTAL